MHIDLEELRKRYNPGDKGTNSKVLSFNYESKYLNTWQT